MHYSIHTVRYRLPRHFACKIQRHVYSVPMAGNCKAAGRGNCNDEMMSQIVQPKKFIFQLHLQPSLPE